MKKTSFIPLVTCALMGLSAQGQNLLVNGSFEQGDFPGGAFAQLTVGSTALPGWTVVGDEVAWIASGNLSITAADGSLCLDLSGTSDRPPHGGVTQTAPTVAGGLYSLTFALGTNPDIESYKGPLTVIASAGSVSLPFKHDPKNGTGTQWSTYGFEFEAEGDTTTITLLAESGRWLIGLDDVVLVALSTPPADADGDGVPNGVDQCPDTLAGVPVDSTGCALLPPDADSDGVADEFDLCADTPAGVPVDSTGCPLSFSDADGDGVADEVDMCPDTPAEAIVDAYGCSLKQLVPCEGSLTGGPWKNHGQYVSSLAAAVELFVAEGLLTEKEAKEVFRMGVQSGCGKRIGERGAGSAD